MLSSARKVERARPLLGTTVAIRVEGLSEPEAHSAISEAFDEVALVHGLMSFQEPASDISRLNREAFDRTLDVHPATFEVLHCAKEMSEASDGIFDIMMAPHLVAAGLLPRPEGARAPDAAATCRDVEINDDYRVRFRKPLWIDVSGIAKGYAVDRAIECLLHLGAPRACVNAGGDLRLIGPQTERVQLRAELHDGDTVPVLEVRNAAVASSSTHTCPGGHIDPRSGAAVPPDRFVCAITETCMIADALTKPLLIMGEASLPVLKRYRAVAHLHDPRHGWRELSGNR